MKNKQTWRKCNLYSREKALNNNCLHNNLDLVISRQKLYSRYYKYLQGPKERCEGVCEKSQQRNGNYKKELSGNSWVWNSWGKCNYWKVNVTGWAQHQIEESKRNCQWTWKSNRNYSIWRTDRKKIEEKWSFSAVWENIKLSSISLIESPKKRKQGQNKNVWKNNYWTFLNFEKKTEW